MTISGNDIVRDALEHIIVQAEESSIRPDEARAAIRSLNDMMLDWDSKGVTLGYTVISTLGDEITVPLGAVRGIKSNLALELAPRYNVPLSAELIRLARDGYKTCVDLAVDLADTEYPPTLPIGSGNTGFFDQTFYPDQQSTILTESGGSVALEEETE